MPSFFDLARPDRTSDAKPVSPVGGDLFGGLDVGRRLGGRLGKAISVYAAGKTSYELGKKAYEEIQRRRLYTTNVYAIDDLYRDVLEWLVSMMPPEQNRTLAAVTTGPRLGEAVPVDISGSTAVDERKLKFVFDSKVPNKVTIQGHRIGVQLCEPEGNDGDERKRQYMSQRTCVRFSAYSPAAHQAVQNHLLSLHEKRQVTDRRPRLKIGNRWGGWNDRHDLPGRAADTVVLPDGQWDELIAHMTDFFANEADYARTGTPWHTGILLTGPAGTGKTSILRALASHFGMDVYLMPLSEMDSDAELMGMVAQVPARAFLVLEDADSFGITHDRDGAEDGKPESTVQTTTLAGLLNSLDGLVTPHGLVIGGTSNKPERFDEAMVRPGRFDLHMTIDYVTDFDVMARLVELVVPGAPMPALVDLTPDRKIVPPAVINALRRHRDPVAAFEQLGLLAMARR